MKRQQRTVGSIIKINLDDNTHSYGIVLEKASIAVFNIKTNNELTVSDILKEDILFFVAVYNSAITSGRWQKITKVPLKERFKTLPLAFVQDSINPENFEIYDPNTGVMAKATKEQCLTLDCASVWEAEHVESRIQDHFNGKENIWLRQLQIK